MTNVWALAALGWTVPASWLAGVVANAFFLPRYSLPKPDPVRAGAVLATAPAVDSAPSSPGRPERNRA